MPMMRAAPNARATWHWLTSMRTALVLLFMLALAAIPGAECDVLISDVGLPDGNGWELLRRLGSERPRYAVAMSGFGMASDRERSLAAGYRHHLLKPVEPNQLEHLLDEAATEMAAQ